MSVFCPKCGKRTYNEYNCDHCQHEIKPKNYVKTKKETITINKNTILVISVVVIAISVAYLGINKYRENQAAEELTEILLGTSDPEEIKQMTKKSIEEIKHTLSNPPTFKFPEIKVKESKYEEERRLKKERERRAKIAKQIEINNNKRKAEIAKEELKKQMSF